MSTHDEIAEELERLGDLLIQENFIKDSGPLYNARAQLQKDPNKYIITGLEFVTTKGDFIRGGVWDEDIEIKMNAEVKVSGAFEFHNVERMIIDLEYICYDKDLTKECKGCWHMDYHVYPGTVNNYMHPDFHIHHGGRNISGLEDFGRVVLLDSPRVMHNPLDAFLAIDFIISNFYPQSVWRGLRGHQIYKRIIEKAQHYWWKPYYENLASYWEYKEDKSTGSQKIVSEAQKLNPHFL